MFHSTREILDAIKAGTLSVPRAEKLLRINALAIVDEIARLEINRELRRGVPEIIYAAGKNSGQLYSIVERIVSSRISQTDGSSPVILSKLRDDQYASLNKLFRKNRKIPAFKETRVDVHKEARIIVLRNKAGSSKKIYLERNRGRVALLAAGTSDIPAVTEAEVVLQVMNCDTLHFNDVGVATLARLSGPLKEVERYDPDALIVAAGMEAALPSLIAGLSGIPVIGLPTSVGYGYGKGGEAALMSMLQACPLGIGVVNIDGGVAAGVVAGLIAKRCADLRGKQSRRT